MTQSSTKARAVLLAVLLVCAAVAMPMSVAAQTNETDGEDPIDGWLDSVDEENAEDESDGILSRIGDLAPESSVSVLAAIDGQLERMIRNPFRDIPGNEDTAAEFERAVATHNDTFESEINAETNVTTAYDTHAVIIGHEDGGDAVAVYLVGDVADGNISNVRVLSEDEFNATDRETDELWVVDGDAAENLPELVETFADRIESGEEVGPAYQRRLGGRYCSAQSPFSGSIVELENCDIRSTMWLTEEQALEGGAD